MGEGSAIEWTHHSFNAWEGCFKISPGCKFCYAAARDERWHGGEHWGESAPRYFHNDAYWRQPVRWDRAAAQVGERHRVFCSSLADVFEDRADLRAERSRLFRLIDSTPNLDWLLLTKRPENMVRLAVDAGWLGAWPTNVWAGSTTEDQEYAEKRIPKLLEVPAVVRFLSYEPALGPVDFTRLRDDEHGALWNALAMGIDWVICGGESGSAARPFDLAWGRAVRDQCAASNVAFFMKQMGTHRVSGTSKLDPELVHISKGKGGDILEWPSDLRVRQFPRLRTKVAA